jgi:hypothetical protein
MLYIARLSSLSLDLLRRLNNAWPPDVSPMKWYLRVARLLQAEYISRRDKFLHVSAVFKLRPG